MAISKVRNPDISANARNTELKSSSVNFEFLKLSKMTLIVWRVTEIEFKNLLYLLFSWILTQAYILLIT